MEENRLFSDSAITDPFTGIEDNPSPIIKVIGVGGDGKSPKKRSLKLR